MRLSIKFAIYFIIIASEIDHLWSRPIEKNNKEQGRKKRQVVQPKWLSGGESLFVDPNVRVTEQNLKEAAAIRDSINKAISSGTFFVNDDQPNAPIPTAERSKPVNPSKPFPKPIPKFEMPQFEFPQFDISQFNFTDFTDFDFREFDFSDFDPSEFFSTQQRTAFVKQISSLWQQFWDTSKKVIGQFN